MTLPLVITSIGPGRVARQQQCVESWRNLGLKVYSLNHPSEISGLAPSFPGVEFVPTEATSIAQFGRHCVTVNGFLDWAVTKGSGDELILLINSDIELEMTTEELEGAASYAESGLWIFVRYDYQTGMRSYGTQLRQCEGVDGFMFRARHAQLFKRSFLCIGQPAWDYWIPLAFMDAGHPVWTTNDTVAMHELHTRGWSMSSHEACLKELARLQNVKLAPNQDVLWHKIILGKRRLVTRKELTATMVYKHTSVDQIFGRLRQFLASMPNATILELGACDGKYTERLLSLLPNPPAALYSFECDPRNVAKCRANPVFKRPGVHLIESAIGKEDGEATFNKCSAVGADWSESSSLCPPTAAMGETFNWLRYLPEDQVTVPVRSLDSFTAEKSLGGIDLIFADIEGAERLMIEGGQKTLARTKYLYMEVWEKRIYEGSWVYSEILAHLPGWGVIERFPGDVLLRNLALTPEPPEPDPSDEIVAPVIRTPLPADLFTNDAPFWIH